MNRKGFTLIELLIVVAIIAILAAIAVPNFLEAQTRSKVSRVKADMRSIATALESYLTDWNHYPRGEYDFTPGLFGHWGIKLVYQLTTPIAYMTNVNLIDPFVPNKDAFGSVGFKASYQYFNYGLDGQWGALILGGNPALKPLRAWCLESWGPNQTQEAAEWIVYEVFSPTAGGAEPKIDRIYDPSNGTISRGDVIRVGGAVPGTVPPLN